MKNKRKPVKKRVASGVRRKGKYWMRLYVTGATPRSTAAITNLRKLCEDHLKGNYSLEVVDMYQQPALARKGKVVAAPTLVKSFPLPLRRFIGDMSNKDALLAGLEIQVEGQPGPDPEPPAKGKQ